MKSIQNVKGVHHRDTPVPPPRHVSATVVGRLPRYHRYLAELIRVGKLRVSSSELSEMMCTTASQIRQDLNCFGGFGQQGYGYPVEDLYRKIGELLGVEEHYGAVFVGLGHLGHSLVDSAMLERRGIRKLAVFETDPAKIGTTVAGMPVLDTARMGEFCRKNRVDIAVLAVPKEQAAPCARILAEAGVRGIWNFSDTELDLRVEGVKIKNMHLSDALLSLCYELRVEDFHRAEKEEA